VAGFDGATFEWAQVPLLADARDTTAAAQWMATEGCGCIVVLGGDGTNRAVAKGWRAAPLVPVSTGTNNVFPVLVEATAAGAAAGLVAAGVVPLAEVATRSKLIDIEIEHEPADLALVDAVLVNGRFTGAGAVDDPAGLRAAVVARAEPAGVGISPIAGMLLPSGIDDDHAVHVSFAGRDQPATLLRAPLLPGRYATIAVAGVARLALGEPVELRGPGVLALDGERARAVDGAQRVVLRVERTGPWVIDVNAAVACGANRFVAREFAHAG
jgi:predicted polyphosphate/ATP-dependent NAD kinase